ncbi:hypothetical protein JL722_11838 [Aureococcus anophagefferens]|nr:hypothetical protein JL722_11838 [Aureococcus anophagefferens]
MSSAKTRAPPALIFAAGAVAGVAAWKALERHLRQRLYAERFAAGPRPPPWLRRLTKVVLGGASNPTTVAGDATAAAPRASLPADVVHEMLSRHEAFFGSAGHDRVRGATVVVFGLGGVGSHCAVMLARAGVAALRLVDFDHVSLSSLNRHAVATLDDVGSPKARVLADHVAKVAPFVAVEGLPQMVTAACAEAMLAPVHGRPVDLVVDCIDDVETKAALLETCCRLNIKALSAMGAGAKADPTKLCVAPLADAVHDPLAVKLRWKLRQRGVAAGAKNFGAVDVDHFRVRVMPVLGASPALMGHALAAVALCGLAGQPVLPKSREPLSKKLKEKMLIQLRKREARRERGPDARPEDCSWADLANADMEYVVNDVWRGRCAATRRKLERKPLALTRWWRCARPLAPFAAGAPRDGGPAVAADALVLLAPHLADALDAALDAAAAAGATGDADLARAAGAALGDDVAAEIDARIVALRAAAGGAF